MSFLTTQQSAAPSPPAPLPTITSGFLKDDEHAKGEMRIILQNLVQSVDADAVLDPEAEAALMQVASEFLDSVTNFSSRLARHRASESLDVKDLALHLERHHKIRIPGFLPSDEAMPKPPAYPGVAGYTPNPTTASSNSAGVNGSAAGANGAEIGGKGKEKDKDVAGGGTNNKALTIRSKRLAAVKGK